MALKTPKNRISSVYGVTHDTAVSNTMVVDATGGSGILYGFELVAGAGNLFLRFYDSASAVAGTTVPKMAFIVPSGTSFSLNVPEGIPFTDGISYNATSTDADPASAGGYGATSTLYLYTT
tara:strand:- start:1637 stop:1999 length:363 start_codon:yes stop_codon:yes gene_type:complete